MNEDKVTGGMEENDGIVFNPPAQIESDETSPIPETGDVSIEPSTSPALVINDTSTLAPPPPAPKPSVSLAEEVGLKVTSPTTASKAGNDFSKILHDVKLPERYNAATTPKNAIPLSQPISPSSAVTASMPEYIRSHTLKVQPALGKNTQNVGPISVLGQEIPSQPNTALQQESPGIVSLHTMKGDLQHAIQHDKISTIRAVAMEEDKRAKTLPPPKPNIEVQVVRSGWGVFRIILALTLFLLGGGALYATYFVATKTSKPSSNTSSSSFIFSEQQTTLQLDGQRPDTLKQALARIAVSVGSGSGSIVQIIPVTSGTSTSGVREATLLEFLNALGARPPEELQRTASQKFFFGIQSSDVPSPILIIPIDSYNQGFAGMLAWEKTIDSQLSPPFKTVPYYLPLTSTSTPANIRTFTDAILQNFDVRTLKDDDGSVAMYYAFPTENLLVIAGSPFSFSEILSRLKAQRRL